MTSRNQEDESVQASSVRYIPSQMFSTVSLAKLQYIDDTSMEVEQNPDTYFTVNNF